MDSGPFRSPQPAERRVPSRSAQVPRAAEPAQQPVKEEPRPSYRAESQAPAPAKRSLFKRFILPILIVVVLLALGVVGYSAWSKANSGLAIDGGKYQAVFFTNGQVYFGKLQTSGSDYLKLTDIFYLQAQSSTKDADANLQETSSDENNVQLIKLGNEVHGPEDQMIISKDQVLFYENLKADGKVAQSIEKYKTK